MSSDEGLAGVVVRDLELVVHRVKGVQRAGGDVVGLVRRVVERSPRGGTTDLTERLAVVVAEIEKLAGMAGRAGRDLQVGLSAARVVKVQGTIPEVVATLEVARDRAAAANAVVAEVIGRVSEVGTQVRELLWGLGNPAPALQALNVVRTGLEEVVASGARAVGSCEAAIALAREIGAGSSGASGTLAGSEIGRASPALKTTVPASSPDGDSDMSHAHAREPAWLIGPPPAPGGPQRGWCRPGPDRAEHHFEKSCGRPVPPLASYRWGERRHWDNL